MFVGSLVLGKSQGRNVTDSPGSMCMSPIETSSRSVVSAEPSSLRFPASSTASLLVSARCL